MCWCLSVYVEVFVCASVWVCAGVCVQVYACIQVHACVHASVCACMCVGVCVHTCVCVHAVRSNLSDNCSEKPPCSLKYIAFSWNSCSLTIIDVHLRLLRTLVLSSNSILLAFNRNFILVLKIYCEQN